ncbi:hypothetical protein BC827DRAFT_1237236 [Russula dissimulans]|nr:hypothetical protein BC827DRAFT_1237236 [Russula dissimulans]
MVSSLRSQRPCNAIKTQVTVSLVHHPNPNTMGDILYKAVINYMQSTRRSKYRNIHTREARKEGWQKNKDFTNTRRLADNLFLFGSVHKRIFSIQEWMHTVLHRTHSTPLGLPVPGLLTPGLSSEPGLEGGPLGRNGGGCSGVGDSSEIIGLEPL